MTTFLKTEALTRDKVPGRRWRIGGLLGVGRKGR